MRVWKKQTVRYSLNGKTVPKGTHGARKVKILSKRYYGTLNMANGKRRQQPLCEERKSSEILLRRLQAEEDRGHAVGEDSYAAASKKPISNHIDDYREHLISKGNTQKYVSLAVGRVNRILASVNARKISDLEPSSITSRLLVMRTAKKGAISVETSNHYVRAIKSFSRWLPKESPHRACLSSWIASLSENPLAMSNIWAICEAPSQITSIAIEAPIAINAILIRTFVPQV